MLPVHCIGKIGKQNWKDKVQLESLTIGEMSVTGCVKIKLITTEMAATYFAIMTTIIINVTTCAIRKAMLESLTARLQLRLCTCTVKPNIHDTIWSHMIYKSQCVYYKIVRLYVAYDVSYRIELLSIPYDTTKSYATKSQRV